MSTKWKIIVGFVLMVLITGVVVFLGYTGIQKSSEGFTEYQRLAKLNVATSELEIALDTAAGNMYAYTSSKDAKFISDAKSAVKRFAATLNDNESFIHTAKTKELFALLHKEIKAFETIIDRVPQNTVGNDKQYRDVVVVAAWAIIDHLKKMTRLAEGTGNSMALSAISRVWADMTQFMSGISRYANTHTKEDADIVAGYINNMNATLTDLDQTLHTEAGRQDIAILQSHYTNLNSAFKNMVELSTILKEDLVTMDTFIADTITTVRQLSATINDQMQSFGIATLKNNDGAQTSMLAAGSISLILGIIIAFFIVFGIIKVLREMAVFAGSVSKGDFDYQLKIKEKGEIGEMIQAMRAIPDVLERIIVTINDIANDIRKGKLRERLNPSTLPGSFSKLGMAINTVNDSYTGLIDALPLPVITCDKELHIIFANASGQAVLGNGHLSMFCGDRIGAAECNSTQCLGKKAISGKSSITAETTIHPQNKRMDVAITVIPVFDMGGEASGFVEIITDLTEIKARQATTLKVAQDASSIADRVAAASEQIAAQVEQISRGAEIQRERVETTASAMSEMNSTVLEVARNAGQASEQSEGTRHRAVEGAQLVDKVVGAIHKVNDVGQKLHDNMQELGHQAESIGGVMNVISDIADQTNLLALNAAIEAARAGEAGRGFAVVADEVRKLAEKTMEATKEVGSNINAIQHSAKVNQKEVDNAVHSVGEATELAHASGAALKEIVTLATGNSSVVTSIATAAEEQSATSEEINAAIDEISRITGETTDGMVQSSAAVQELSHMAQELRRVMEGLH